MTKNDTIVAVFANHHGAEDAIRKLSASGLDIKHFSIMGKGYHTEEKVVGFYNTGDRMMFWGKTGALWGGLWGLFFGGMVLTIPVVGPVMVLGHLAAMVFAMVEGAAIAGGLGVLGAAMLGLGIPEDSTIEYEEALKADRFLLVAHGPIEEMARAKAILETLNPVSLDVHLDVRDGDGPIVDPAARSKAA
jgi:hypothetical protein